MNFIQEINEKLDAVEVLENKGSYLLSTITHLKVFDLFLLNDDFIKEGYELTALEAILALSDKVIAGHVEEHGFKATCDCANAIIDSLSEAIFLLYDKDNDEFRKGFFKITLNSVEPSLSTEEFYTEIRKLSKRFKSFAESAGFTFDTK